MIALAQRSLARRLTVVVATVVCVLVVGSGIAAAHPLGMPAVARVAVTDTGTVMVWWTAPPDDLAVLASHLGIVQTDVITPQNDRLVSGSSAMADGLLAGIRVTQQGRACPGSAAIGTLLGEGAHLAFRCRTASQPVALTIDVLAPVDDRYTTIVAAGTPAGIERYTLVGGDTISVLLDPASTGEVMRGNPLVAAGSEALGARLPVEARLVALVDGSASLPAALVGMLLALGVGVVHGAMPGHGKALAAAYLIGDHGRRRDAVRLGAAVAVMHTGSVLALGLLLYGLTRQVSLGAISGWLQIVAGALIFAVGMGMVHRRQQRPDHDHGPHHDHDHGVHVHPTGHAASAPRVAVLGAAGGLMPSPTALVVLLTALATGQLGYGLVLVGLFGMGLAVTVTLAGLLVVWGRDRIAALAADGILGRGAVVLAHYAPLGAMAVVVGIGAMIATRGVLSL